MTKRLSARLSYALVLSILLVLLGFLGLGIRAFESAAVSDFIYFVALGVFLAALTVYFVLRRPHAGAGIDRKVRLLPSARSGQVPLHAASGQKDRRRPLAPGQERAVVAYERRSGQLAGFRAGNQTLRA